MNVKISIVIAVKNMAGTIERAMKSVFGQTYKNFELIVMDACSSDGTVDIIKKYDDKLTYWVSKSDNGPSDAIAKALPFASGEYIGFLGADDWYEPYALESVAKAITDGRGDLYYGNMLVHNGEKCEFKDLKEFDPDKLYLGGTQWLGAVCAFVKKGLLFDNYKKKNDVLLTDYLFFLRLYADNRLFVHIGDERHITNFSIGGRTTTGIYRAIRDTEMVRHQFLEEYPQMKEKYLKYKEKLRDEYAMGVAGYYSLALNDKRFERYKKEFLFSDSECILFGSGKMGKACAKLLVALDINIVCFVDNDSTKWGKKTEELYIYNPDILFAQKDKCIVVTPALLYEEEIRNQLDDMNIDTSCRIVSYSEIARQVYDKLGDEILDKAWKEEIIS